VRQMKTQDWQERLREAVSYDPLTGLLHWKERPLSHFVSVGAWRSWNTKWAGKRAFRKADKEGYLLGKFQQNDLKAHRVAWIVHYGSLAADTEIDHINGDPSDNRIANLRLATRAENGRNTRIRVDNTTGFKGVCKIKGRNKWRAQIKVGNRKGAYGLFDTPEDAYAAYCKASAELHGEFGRVA